MKWVKQNLDVLLAGLALLGIIIFLATPSIITTSGNQFGFESIFSSSFNIYTLLGIIFGLAGCVLLALRKKVDSFLGISIILLGICAVSIFAAPTSKAFVNGVIYDETYHLFVGGYIGGILTTISFLFAIYLSYTTNELTTKDIVEMAMLISMAVVLDLKPFKIPLPSIVNGGSISFTMVTLFMMCFRHGPIKGFIGCGIVYGMITCLTDGYGLFCYPFDYLLGYGSICLCAYFSRFIFKAREGDKVHFINYVFLVLSVVVACTARLLFASISGYIFWETEFWASVIYNMTYIYTSMAAVIVILCLLYKPMLIVNRLYPTKEITKLNEIK